ncbi:MAG: flagellin FliC [Deltaproteobacteria bacterium]|nr:flagellin FliC [Deltaproteobacteria bacterium]
MGLRVNSNVASINAQRNLVNSTGALQKSLQRLSSGLRITRAADDAAGLAISEGFRADIRSIAQAQRNANDGISLLQVGEGALNEVSSILIRQRELAIQAANGTLGQAERTTLNNEFQDLLSEINRISAVTQFNGTQILQSGAATVFQIGVDATSNDRITINAVDARASSIGLGTSGASFVYATISAVSDARTTLGLLDAAISQVASLRASFGTVQNRLESTIRSLAIAIENTSAAESRIRDVDVASETANLTRNQVLQQAGVAVLAQANLSTQIALQLLQ